MIARHCAVLGRGRWCLAIICLQSLVLERYCPRTHHQRKYAGELPVTHEVDFVLTARRGAPLTIECKWRSVDLDPTSLLAFHATYPKSELLVVAPDVARTLIRRRDGIEYKVMSLEAVIERANRQ